MNLGKNGARKQLRSLQSTGRKMRTKSVLVALRAVFFALILAAVVSIAGVYGVVRGIVEDSPDMRTINVSPQGIATSVYNAKGELIQTLVASGANRDPVSISKVPQDLINAFVAIEDSRYWQHHGVDLRGMIRAAILGARSGFRRTQGASTITQQLIKNNVFSGGAESGLGAKVIRKIQEQYLAMELEKVMSKQEILENYLNTINLGSNCLGVQTAARRYFDKDVSELTLSECAVIAGITQNPVGYNPITHPDDNEEKRAIVLEYMVRQGYITKEQQQEALADDVYTRIQVVNNKVKESGNDVYSYFVDRLITEVQRDLVNKLGYTREEANHLLYSGGLEIYTTQDPEIQAIVDDEISNPSNYTEVDNKYSFTYYLAVNRDGEAMFFNESNIRVELGMRLNFDEEDKIYETIKQFKNRVLKNGDRIISEVITPMLQPQASITFMEQSTGEVKAISGGRGKKSTSLSLNRASSARRSPGSTFKVLTAFAPAIDAKGQTLASTYYDEPYTEPTTGKTFRNWWGEDDYVGYANIRDGIVYSMNILATKCLNETVTPKLGFEYAEDFGFNTLYASKEVNGSIFTDISPSLALGGLTDGVTNLQLTAAYATIANLGTYTQPIFYTKILDRAGNVLLENIPETHQVIQPSTAFLLTDAMAGSLQPSSLFGLHSSTSTAAAPEDGMPAAGKSGTSTSKADLWFVGYTPYYTMGIWSGFDDQSPMEANESSSYHKVIWKHIMERVDAAKHLRNKDFAVPADIVAVDICAKSGKLVKEGVCTGDSREGVVYTEYFKKGTEPTETCDVHYAVKVCADSGMKPTKYCPKTRYKVLMHLPEERTGQTDDNRYAGGKAFKYCTKHTAEAAAAAEEKKKAEEQKKKEQEQAAKDLNGLLD